MILKYAILGAVAGLLSTVVNDTAAQIAVFAAGAAGLGYLWKNVLWPFVRLVQVLEDLPDWCRGVDQRLGGLEHKVSATHEPVEAIAREFDIPHRQPDPPGPPPV